MNREFIWAKNFQLLSEFIAQIQWNNKKSEFISLEIWTKHKTKFHLNTRVKGWKFFIEYFMTLKLNVLLESIENYFFAFHI
jgi:hypothetical protein